MLTIHQLQVKYGQQTALSIDRPVTWEENDRIGIIGSNGAGKSTLIKAILGITDYTGTIEMDVSPEEIGVHMQFNAYANTMNIKYIIEAVLNTNIRDNKKLRELIAFFQFEKCLKKRFASLSGGEKQRLTIILVLMQEARLVFFDEVTSGLDFETRQKLMQKLVLWYREHPTTVCVVSHYYEELDQMADKLFILDKGRAVDFGKKEELFQKYCGSVIITMDNNERNRSLTAGRSTLKAPDHLLAVSCRDGQEEMELSKTLILENINFKRSNTDIEILYMNAIDAFQKAQGGACA